MLLPLTAHVGNNYLDSVFFVYPVDTPLTWEKLETLVSRKVSCQDLVWAFFNSPCLAVMRWPFGELINFDYNFTQFVMYCSAL